MRPLALAVLVVSALGCDDDDTGTLAVVSSSDRKVIPFTAQGPCFVAPLFDEDPDTVGLQPSCTGSFTLADGTEEILPMCGNGDDPCWSLVPDAVACPDSGLFVSIQTSGLAFGADATATIECLLAD
ncbi:MAG: hypothetical protein SFX73_37920 [Kofleriaceae bacterium]|nr:hypothetical protein [Kofleriaceae bacterium]